MKKLNKLKENSEWQHNDNKNKINAQEKYFPKAIKILKMIK